MTQNKTPKRRGGPILPSTGSHPAMTQIARLLARQAARTDLATLPQAADPY